VIFGEFREWLSEVLQVDLEATVDMSCSKYEHTGKPSDNFSTNHWGVEVEMMCSLVFDVSLSLLFLQMFCCVTMMSWRDEELHLSSI